MYMAEQKEKKGNPVKCPICKEKHQKNEMIFDEKSKRWYCQDECFEVLGKQREWQQKETREWNELFEYIKELHDVVTLNQSTINQLRDLRAGYVLDKNRERRRGWANGPSYGVMLEAYKLAENKIKKALNTTLERDKSDGAINYCLKIMIGEINQVAENRRNRKRQEEAIAIAQQKEAVKDSYNQNRPTETFVPKKKVDKKDISSFL